MKFQFYKYQGAGNDFIMIDDRNKKFPVKNHEFIRRFCNRRFGVGADGLILLQNDASSDFRMVYFNADGYEGSMCGNGGRCIVAFAKQLQMIDIETTFIATDGLHEAKIHPHAVELKMSDVNNIQNLGEDWVLNTGSPHYVRFVEDIHGLDVYTEGRKIRNSEPFKKEGINVNFVQKKTTELGVATFERGVEDETLSCGTGITASALVYGLLQPEISEVSVVSKGGNLKVRFQNNGQGKFSDIWLMGAATFVFEGVF